MESALEIFQMVSKVFDAQYHTTASSDCLAPKSKPFKHKPTAHNVTQALKRCSFFLNKRMYLPSFLM